MNVLSFFLINLYLFFLEYKKFKVGGFNFKVGQVSRKKSLCVFFLLFGFGNFSEMIKESLSLSLSLSL